MKFFHIADVHLGAEPDKGYPWSKDRSREIWDSFRKVIKQAGEEKAGLFLIAGDLFHRQPLMKEVKEVNYLFSSIPDTRIVLIAGNHDYIRHDSVYKKVKWAPNVFWLWESELSCVDFPELDTRVCGLSYDKREISEAYYDKISVTRRRGNEILLAHGGDEKHIPIDKNFLAQSQFDYIALGHIHKPQVLLENRAIYAGALEPIDCNDLGAHGFVKGEIREGRVKIQFEPFARREYKVLKVQVSEKTTQYSLEATLKKAMEERGTWNIFHVLLEGKKSLETEFLYDRLQALGNVRSVEDRTLAAYSVEKLKEQYAGSVLEEYMNSFGEGRTQEEEKAFHYGISALLESAEESL